MNMDLYHKITNKTNISHKNIGHDTINLVDDSTNVIYTEIMNT